MHGSGSARGCDSSGRLALRNTCRDAAIFLMLGEERKLLVHARNEVDDPDRTFIGAKTTCLYKTFWRKGS